MREDMKEVLVTDGRRGSSYAENEQVKKLRRTRIKDDDVGGRMQMLPKVRYGWYERKTDQKGEHLTPLKRYLRSKIGSNWDDIWSEIKQNNPSNSAVGAHIYTHVEGYVNLQHEVSYHEGQPGRWRRWGSKEDKTVFSPLRPGELYVDEQNILRITPEIRDRRHQPEIIYRKVDKYNYLVKNLQDNWFLWTYSDAKEKYTYYVREPLMKDHKYQRDENDHIIYVSVERIGAKCKHPEVNVNLDKYEKRVTTNGYTYTRHKLPNPGPDFYIIKVKSISNSEKHLYGIEQ